jgi:hypothetical protein
MKLAALVAGILLVASSSFAADAEHTESTTVDHSSNPITGSHTIKVKHHHKKKNMDGENMDAKSTETTTVKKDGSIKKEVKVEEKAAQ